MIPYLIKHNREKNNAYIKLELIYSNRIYINPSVVVTASDTWLKVHGSKSDYKLLISNVYSKIFLFLGQVQKFDFFGN